MEENNILVYPNPTTGIVYIKTNNIGEKVSIAIYNTSGKNVYSNPAFTGSIINVSELYNGLYLVKVTSGAKVANIKLLKE